MCCDWDIPIFLMMLRIKFLFKIFIEYRHKYSFQVFSTKLFVEGIEICMEVTFISYGLKNNFKRIFTYFISNITIKSKFPSSIIGQILLCDYRNLNFKTSLKPKNVEYIPINIYMRFLCIVDSRFKI